MTETSAWTRGSDGLLCATINGTQYRVRFDGTWRGRERWQAEHECGQHGVFWNNFCSPLPTEQEAQRTCAAEAQHRLDVLALGRTQEAFGRDGKTRTPWGRADCLTRYSPGLTFYGTPDHGGFKVCKRLLATFPDHLRNADGWYEEDGEASKVVLALPHLFTEYERRAAVENRRISERIAVELRAGDLDRAA